MNSFFLLAPTSNSLEHSAKGSTWKKHKYIRIENGRYIYDRAKNKVRDAVGISAKEDLQKKEADYAVKKANLDNLVSNYNRLGIEGLGYNPAEDISQLNSKANTAFGEYLASQAAYDQTLLGRKDKAIEKFNETIDKYLVKPYIKK